jgi:hypothetical protein
MKFKNGAILRTTRSPKECFALSSDPDLSNNAHWFGIDPDGVARTHTVIF